MNSIKIFFLPVFFLLSCSLPAQDDAVVNSEKDVLLNLENEWTAAFQNKDLEKILTFYAPDIVVMLPDLPPLTGIDEVKDAVGMGLNDQQIDWSSFSINIEDVEISSSGDLAVVRYTDSILIANSPSVSRGLDILKKTDGEWKCIIIMKNSNKTE